MSDSASSAAAAAAELGELGAATEFTSNIIDLTAGNATSASAGGGDSGAPSFFILHSSTSLFAGVPHMHGKLDGEALAATFNSPQDIVVDRNQQLFIADANNASIRRINKLGKVRGATPQWGATLALPSDICIDGRASTPHLFLFLSFLP